MDTGYAEKNAQARAGAIGGGRSLNGGLASGSRLINSDTAVDVEKSPSVVYMVQMDLENLLATFREVADRQRSQYERAFGPRNEAGKDNGAPVPGGQFGLLTERLGWLKNLSQEILDNQIRLEQIN